MYAAKLMRDFEAFRTCMAMDSAEVTTTWQYL